MDLERRDSRTPPPPGPGTALEPPGRDELPEWLQQEIEESETRYLIRRDMQRCRTAREHRRTMLAGVLIALAISFFYQGFDPLGTALVAATAALGSWLILHFELGAPLGAIVYGVPVLLAGTFLDGQVTSLLFFFLAATLTGAIMALNADANRGLNRGG